MRAQAHLAVLAEDRAREGQQRALEVGQRDVLVDGQALDLVEHRRVRRVELVAAVGAPGDDDVEGRRLGLHRADLHRRGVRAQHHVVGHVEGVGAIARGVRRAVVERVEVVVDGVDLGAFEDGEAQADEDVLDLAPGRREQVQAPDGLRRLARQGDVDAVGGQASVELARLELGGARLDEALERLARLVGRPPDRAALLGRQLGHAAQEVGQLRLAPQVAHTQLLEGRGRVGRRDSALGLGPQLVDALDHGAVTLVDS